MAKRAVVGIPFNYDENWIGGSYYVKNVVAAMGLLPEWRQPQICLLSHQQQSFDYIKNETGYPRLEWVRPSFVSNVSVGPSRKWLLISKLIPSFLRKQREFDAIFPFPIGPEFQQTICWIPDFQDKRLPQLFTQEELNARAEQHRYFYKTFRYLVFSSQTAQADFDYFYPDNQVRKFVVRFAVFDQPGETPSFSEIREKYQLPEVFFYCPNQFWIHKNHETVIRAAALLKSTGQSICIVFSGKEHDHRAPEHVPYLKSLAVELGVESSIRFVGFIPRSDQMTLFRSARLIIQPSLFEGWSTVIEDCRSVSQYVIASDIPTHREQIESNVEFFPGTVHTALAHRLRPYLTSEPKRVPVDYQQNRLRFAEDFMRVVDTVMADRKPH